MDKGQAIDVVGVFAEAIRRRYRPVRVVLYGSYARSEQRPGSDIDVAVIVDRIDDDFLDAEAELYRIRRGIDDRIEPVLLELGRDGSGFIESVLRSGETVYEREDAADLIPNRL